MRSDSKRNGLAHKLIIERHKRIGYLVQALFGVLFGDAERHVLGKENQINEFLQRTGKVGGGFVAACHDFREAVAPEPI